MRQRVKMYKLKVWKTFKVARLNSWLSGPSSRKKNTGVPESLLIQIGLRHLQLGNVHPEEAADKEHRPGCSLVLLQSFDQKVFHIKGFR